MSAPDVVVGALEDGVRPPTAPPDQLERVWCVVTGEACPRCGTALGVLLGPTPAVNDAAGEIQTRHGGALPDEWTDTHERPVYLFCDHPRCPWQATAEWADVRPVLEAWIQRDAPTWRDRVTGRGEA